MSHYVLRGGTAGSERMSIVAKACWPNTLNLLKKAGLKEGMQCLDLGCGAGDVTIEIARLIGAKGRVMGIDMDPIKIEKAQLHAIEEGFTNTQFIQGNVYEWVESNKYDLIYIRFLLTHLPDRERLYPQLLRGLTQNGVLIIEDIDFEGHVSYPTNAAFSRYVNLYQQVVLRRGGDPNLGRKLFEKLIRTGFHKTAVNIVYPEHSIGIGKEMSLLTLKNISDSLLEENLITQPELTQLITDLEHFTHDPSTIVSAARIFQIWGYKP